MLDIQKKKIYWYFYYRLLPPQYFGLEGKGELNTGMTILQKLFMIKNRQAF
jgi:hypothetical protein